jgi:hypothetical protein
MRDLQPVNIETHLKNAVIFNELEDEEIALIAKGAREVRYDKGAPSFIGAIQAPASILSSSGRSSCRSPRPMASRRL